MLKHEFGIMETSPLSGQRYDKYEPKKYDCISVSDRYILPLSEKLSGISFFRHTVDVEGKGLAYWGITLISPDAAGKMLPLTESIHALEPLAKLLRRAIDENKYVIHFGI